jgi:16S rRNA (cytosine967-C5)-methyltransferase
LAAAAAPGGKAFAMLAFEPKVELTLADVAFARIVGRVRSNLRRLGRVLPMLVADAGAPAVAKAFDRVVLDLPCSGTGTLRKHPELKWRIQSSEIGRLARQSRRLLDGAVPLVRPGGLLVAITCSLEPEENDAVVAEFLAHTSEFSLLDLTGRLPYPLERWLAGKGRWQILPGDHHDGFTLHVLVRKEANS